MKSDKQLRRSNGVTVPLDNEEKELLQTIAFAAGKKPATMCRSLLYRGIAAYLKDRRDEEAELEESQIYERLRKLVQGDRQLDTVYKVIRSQGNGSETVKTGTR